MAQNNSRFYQLNPLALFEYEFNENYSNEDLVGEYGHRNISEFAPYVYVLATGDKLYVDTNHPNDYATGNTPENMSIPYDYNGITEFHINGDDALTDETYLYYQTANTMFKGGQGKSFATSNDSMPFDKIKIYYVSGYSFDSIYGVYLNVYLNGDNGKGVSICRKIIKKESIGSMFKYLDRPMFISNRIYDKYIEFRVPSAKFLSSMRYKEENDIASYLNVSTNSPIKVRYGEIAPNNVVEYNQSDEDDYNVEMTIKNRPELPYNAVLFTVDNMNTCALPQYANSDKITANIELDKSGTCVSFSGMWDGEPLTNSIVNDFNTRISLYDIKGRTSNNVDLYYADSADAVEWIAYHEVYTKFYKTDTDVTDGNNNIGELKYTQTYNFTQPFDKDNMLNQNITKTIKYRPVIEQTYDIDTVVFEYNMRLINLYDDVQFLRTATLSLSGNAVQKLFNNTVSLDLSALKTYSIFNKIENVKQEITTPVNSPKSTQYTKVFYSTNDIVLDENGNYYGDSTYTLTLSNSPKNYKFGFRKYDIDGNLTIFDMSDMSLILYSRDADGKDIIIEPTYSDNMNLPMGTVEFNISANNAAKLKNVSEPNRFMSVLVVNNDNTKYSMFDFIYN